MRGKRGSIGLIIGYAGAMLGVLAVRQLNQLLIRTQPPAGRMAGMLAVYWLIALVPVIVMLVSRDRLKDYGFCSARPGMQLLNGVLIALGLSAVLTVMPILSGFGAFVGSGKGYRHLWQFAYEFAYCILAVGFTEELVFRGFLLEKLRRITQNDLAAAGISSVLFGLFHIFSGNPVQVILTTLIGLLLCICKQKIRHCTLLSLMLAHGIYDALISVWTFIF